jgi:hypothetical protein
VKVYRRFGRTYHLHPQDRSVSKIGNQSEAGSKQTTGNVHWFRDRSIVRPVPTQDITVTKNADLPRGIRTVEGIKQRCHCDIGHDADSDQEVPIADIFLRVMKGKLKILKRDGSTAQQNRVLLSVRG